MDGNSDEWSSTYFLAPLLPLDQDPGAGLVDLGTRCRTPAGCSDVCSEHQKKVEIMKQKLTSMFRVTVRNRTSRSKQKPIQSSQGVRQWVTRTLPDSHPSLWLWVEAYVNTAGWCSSICLIKTTPKSVTVFWLFKSGSHLISPDVWMLQNFRFISELFLLYDPGCKSKEPWSNCKYPQWHTVLRGSQWIVFARQSGSGYCQAWRRWQGEEMVSMLSILGKKLIFIGCFSELIATLWSCWKS